MKRKYLYSKPEMQRIARDYRYTGGRKQSWGLSPWGAEDGFDLGGIKMVPYNFIAHWTPRYSGIFPNKN